MHARAHARASERRSLCEPPKEDSVMKEVDVKQLAHNDVYTVGVNCCLHIPLGHLPVIAGVVMDADADDQKPNMPAEHASKKKKAAQSKMGASPCSVSVS